MATVTVSKEDFAVVVASSRSIAECLDKLGMRKRGGSYRAFKNRTKKWSIDTSHFLSVAEQSRRRWVEGNLYKPIPLEEILIQNSTYGSTDRLKKRLYKVGLKRPVCELCGQDERWHGKRMAPILDHINGVRTDNRLANLRIVCPNCNATLETHCGKVRLTNTCVSCGSAISPNRKFCGLRCARRASKNLRPASRKVERPPCRSSSTRSTS
jgi:hypothetical protein